jgi:hypothetical protein
MVYEIKYEPITINNQIHPKYNIYYTGGEFDGEKLFHSIDGTSGKIEPGYKKINSPNWLGLEQELVYSTLFPKAINDSDPNWFSILQTALQNGKKNETSESFLLNTLSNLGVVWTTSEKTQLNQILLNNNFTIQIQ